MKKLEAHEVALHKVFSSDYEFHIPEYQRPYAWEQEQAQELLDDLTEALKRADGEPYFLGSVVLVKAPDAPKAEVIDGQQRLTTLTILLAALRELEQGSELGKSLDKSVREPGDQLLDLEPRPRLMLRDRDAKFFRDHVQEPGQLAGLVAKPGPVTENDAQVAIRANSTLLHTTLAGLLDAEREALAKMIVQRTFLVVVSTPDLNSAHRIFSVMNARGLDLEPSDIFKSSVIGALPADKRDHYAELWEDAEQELTRDGFSDLFAHVRTIFAKQRAQRELLKEFQEQVLDKYVSNLAGFVDDVLVPYADAYVVLRNQSHTSQNAPERVNTWLKRLSQLDNFDWQPVALWGLKHYPNDSDWLDKLLSRLERLAAVMLLLRWSPTSRQQRYADVLRGLERGDAPDTGLLDLTDDERREAGLRLDGEIYSFARVRKYVLLRLDEELAHAPGVSYDHKIITVEHVLPQSPAATSQWVQDFSEDKRAYWTHRLANLVLLNRSKNSEAQNYDYEVKKARYFVGKNGVATFALTTQVLQEPAWTPLVLEDRQRTLVKVLRDMWAL